MAVAFESYERGKKHVIKVFRVSPDPRPVEIELDERTLPVTLAFTPDSRRLVVGRAGGDLVVLDAVAGGQLARFRVGERCVMAMSVSPDGQRVATACAGTDRNIAHVYDLASGNRLQSLAGHNGDVESVQYSPDGMYLATGGEDCTVRIWDAETAEETARMLGHERGVSAVVFAPGGGKLYSLSFPNVLKVWKTKVAHEKITFTCTGRLSQAAFSPDRDRVATGSYDGTLTVWDAGSGRELAAVESPNSIQCLAWSPDGQALATGNHSANTRLWDPDTLQEIRALGFGSQCLAFTPDGGRLITGWERRIRLGDLPISVAAKPHLIRVCDVASGEVVSEIQKHEGNLAAIALSPDGHTLATTHELWDWAAETVRATYHGHDEGVKAIAFAPDGSTFVTGSSDKTLKLWEMATGAALRTFHGHTGWVTAVAFSPDGSRIVSGDANGNVKFWDVVSGQEALTIRGHADEVTSVEFSADGWNVLSASSGGQVRVYRAKDEVAAERWLTERRATREREARRRKVDQEGARVAKELLEELGSAAAVIESLEQDEALDALVGKRALQYVNSWLGNTRSLMQEFWFMVQAGGAEMEAYELALERACKACRLEPETPAYMRVRAGALLRLGRPKESLEAFAEAGKLAPEADVADQAAIEGSRVLAYLGLGRSEEARAAFEDFERLLLEAEKEPMDGGTKYYLSRFATEVKERMAESGP